MATTATKPGKAPVNLGAFLNAGIMDLCVLAQVDYATSNWTGIPARSLKEFAAETAQQIAQLALYLELVSRGLKQEHGGLYADRTRLRKLLRGVSQKAKKLTDEPTTANAQKLGKGVGVLARFARRTISKAGSGKQSLTEFGVRNVTESLKILTEKLAMKFAHELAKDAANKPPALLGASLVASAASPGVARAVRKDLTVAGLMRFGTRGRMLQASAGQSRQNRSGALGKLQKFLRRAERALSR